MFQSFFHSIKRSVKNFFATESLTELFFILAVIFIIRTIGFGLYQVPSGSMETTMLVGDRFFADKFTILFSKPQRGAIISFNDPTFAYSKSLPVRLFQEYVWGPQSWTKRVIGQPGDKVRGTVENGVPVIYVNDIKIDEPYINKYPLISLWKDDPEKIMAEVNQKMLDVIMSKSVDAAHLEEYVNFLVAQQQSSPVSYDPTKPFDQQPFYTDAGYVHMNEKYAIKTQDGKYVLREPGMPLENRGVAMVRQGNNYWNYTDEFYVELNDHQYWVMGDNRLGSWDSRAWGPLDEHLIHGKIVFRIWSLDSDSQWIFLTDLIAHPIDFWRRVRWDRCLQKVH